MMLFLCLGELSDLVNTLQHRSRDTTCLDLSDADSQFSVFVSYVEIYNECLYDLLDVIPKKQQERRALPLSEDKSGNIYVKCECRDIRLVLKLCKRVCIRFKKNKCHVC